MNNIYSLNDNIDNVWNETTETTETHEGSGKEVVTGTAMLTDTNAVHRLCTTYVSTWTEMDHRVALTAYSAIQTDANEKFLTIIKLKPLLTAGANFDILNGILVSK